MKVEPEVLNGIMICFGTIVGAILGVISTIILVVERWKTENKKLKAEIEQKNAEIEQKNKELQMLQEQLRKQKQVWDSEIAKNLAETEMRRIEAKKNRRQLDEEERIELHDLLKLLEASTIKIIRENENPIDIFIAMRQLRYTLQNKGASIFRNQNVAHRFQKVIELLTQVDRDVSKRCSALAKFNLEPADNIVDIDISIYNQLLDDFYRERSCHDVLPLITEKRKQIIEHLMQIRKRLDELDQLISKPL